MTRYQYESSAHSSLASLRRLRCDCEVVQQQPFNGGDGRRTRCACACISMRYLFDPWVPKLNVIYLQSFSKWQTLNIVLHARTCPPVPPGAIVFVSFHFIVQSRADDRPTETFCVCMCVCVPDDVTQRSASTLWNEEIETESKTKHRNEATAHTDD